jgi:hypothetical protein
MTSKTAGLLFVNFVIAYMLSIFVSCLIFFSKIKDVLLLLIAGNFFLTVGLTLSALTIFFNVNQNILKNDVSSFLSFFLLPIAVSIALLFMPGSHSDKQFYLVVILCFDFSLLLSFIWFRKNHQNS